jgi:folate-binding protein YgfZ
MSLFSRPPAPTIERVSVAVAASEYERLRADVGLVDRSARGKLLLTGAEAGEFLQGQVTNDVEALAPGTGCYALLLTHKGKIRADMRLLRGEDWFLVDTEPGALGVLLHTVRTYSIGRDVRVEDVTSDRALASLIGPHAREHLDAAPPEAEHGFISGEHGLYVATDLGVDVIAEGVSVDSLAEALSVEPVSEETVECLRVESGRPRLGVDLDDSVIPQEAGLNERAVSFEKGCYVGQETVARLHYKGKPNRHLHGLRLERPGEHGEPIASVEGKAVGALGSTCVSPEHGPIALAILRREVGPGDAVSVGADGVRATVCPLPFAGG